MAIIVNKEEKRRAIALACSELFLEKGIGELTIAELARAAGIGKGTIYEYFENKEDIVFEIIEIFMEEFEASLETTLQSASGTREKIAYCLSAIFTDTRYQKHLRNYQEYLAISLTNGTEEMVTFSASCRERFANILYRIMDEGIAKGEIQPQSRDLVPALLLFQKGLIVDSKASGLDPQREIDRALDTLFALVGEVS
jgi:AcrR family transcriptional regulator